MSLYEKQLRMEELSSETALEKIKHSFSQVENKNVFMLNFIKDGQSIKKYFELWFTELDALIKSEQAKYNRDPRLKAVEKVTEEAPSIAGESSKTIWIKYFTAISSSKIAYITIQEVLKNFNANNYKEELATDLNGSFAQAVIKRIGDCIEDEYFVIEMKKYKSMGKIGKGVAKQQLAAHKLFKSGMLFDQKIRDEEAKKVKKSDKHIWLPNWPPTIKAKIGSLAVTYLIDCAKVFEIRNGEKFERNAFWFAFKRFKGRNNGIIAFDPVLADILKQDPLKNSFIVASQLPMIVMPKPWLTYNSGGFLSGETHRKPCMRISKKCYEQLFYIKKADEAGKINRSLMSLDVLGSTPWKINKKMLALIVKVWNKGAPLADIPPSKEWLIENEPLPEPSDEIKANKSLLAKFERNIKPLKATQSNFHSLRCDTNYKICIAKTFMDDTIYFPHNMDFRGRVYPIPPLFNHLGNDLCRSLLLFGSAKKIGKNGLKWIKIHLANCHGVNKSSFSEREQFINDNIHNVFASADNPFRDVSPDIANTVSSDSTSEGDCSWWLKADDPWQCLAVCIELTSAVRHSVSPEEYESALPIHQDGTCNGLQHYAALGGDIIGANSVNLIDSDKPQDVYLEVLKLVNLKVEADAEKGDVLAKKAKGLITRKVVKQTVMTYVYGVTFIGAREQVFGKLKEIDQLKDMDELDVSSSKSKGFLTSLANYLTKLVFSSLGEMFHNAQLIQKWLNDSAALISQSIPEEYIKTAIQKKEKIKSSTAVVWTTPLGLIITQPYRKQDKLIVNSSLQHIQVSTSNYRTPIDSRKQSSAFPPNFVHSLDASHMMLTSLKMQQYPRLSSSKEMLFFASVHDSYWTHACDIDIMSKLTREAFIELHQMPILENLVNEFYLRYKNFLVPKSKSHYPDDKEVIKGWVPIKFLDFPSKGDLDIMEVEKSTYFFH